MKRNDCQKKCGKQIIVATIGLLSMAIFAPGSIAQTDAERMQQQLNQETLNRPFSTADEKELNSYLEDAKKKNIKPVQTAPSFWRPGYTCGSILGLGYSYRHYRNCRYHHYYYGRYW